MRILYALAATALYAPLTAQPDHFESTPRGFEFVEGGMAIDLIGREPRLRFQQIDDTNRGRNDINRFAFRRDGLLPDDPRYAARTVEMSIVMSETDFSTMSTRFDQNYTANTVTVLNRKNVSFPSWVFAPVVPPASSTGVLIYLDRLYTYPGKEKTGNDLLWEVSVWSNTRANQPYPMDADITILPNTLSTGQPLVPPGCLTPMGRSRLHAHAYNWRTYFGFEVNLWESEPNAPALVFIGIDDEALHLNGLCAPLHVSPGGANAVLPIGTTNPAGFLQATIAPVNYSAAVVGQSFVSQAATLDPQRPYGVALSNGNVTTIPVDPSVAPRARHMWSTSPTATQASSGLVDGGVIIHLNHL